MSRNVLGLVEIGESSCIDEGVQVGYLPSRTIHDFRLVIGDNPIIRSGSVVYAGSIIGDNLETGHNVVIREENTIGDDVRLWNGSVIDYGCVIGHRVKIHSQVYVGQFTTIEDDVFLAPGVILTNDMHPGCGFSKECMEGPTIKRGAQIGGNAVILPRVMIGEYSVIGAGSVVTRDVPPYSVVSGNPARLRGPVTELVCKRGRLHRPYGFLGLSAGEH